MLNKILMIIFVISISVHNVMAQEESAETLKEVDIIVGLEKIITLDFIPNSIIEIANENLV